MKLKASMSRYKYKLKETSTISSTSGFTSGTTGENIGATMGRGPKAGPKGVTDNTYVKKFKYRLVDRSALNKAAKGIEVKQLWETTDVDDYLKSLNVNDINLYNHIKKRIEGFNALEEKNKYFNSIISQSKTKNTGIL